MLPTVSDVISHDEINEYLILSFPFHICRSNFDSPIYSTSSQSSSGMGRPRTKAAMKGYEDLKVSIPTTRLDMHQALERSPNAGGNSSKLATLADIALSNDVPVCLERTIYSKSSSSSSKAVAARKPSKKSLAAEAKKAEALRLSGDLMPKSRKRSQKKSGHMLGFRERKKRPRTSSREKVKSERMPIKHVETEPQDVYEFDESADFDDTVIPPLTHARPTKIDLSNGIQTASPSTATH